MSVSTRSPKKAAPKAKAARAVSDVDAYMRTLMHPLKQEIEAARQTILGVSPKIGESVKWQAPSFHAADYFATINVRAKDQVQIIFHTGVKPKGKRMQDKVADPAGLLKWLAPDRALASLGAGSAFRANQPAMAALTRAWLKAL